MGILKISFITLLGFCSVILHGQNPGTPLKKVGGGNALDAIFGGNAPSLDNAKVFFSDESSSIIKVEYSGFKGRESYTATILNSQKKAIQEIPVIEGRLTATSGVLDLEFSFEQIQKKYTKEFVQSTFLIIEIIKAKSDLNEMEALFGASSFKQLFNYSDKWAVELLGQTMQVSPRAIGRARIISKPIKSRSAQEISIDSTEVDETRLGPANEPFEFMSELSSDYVFDNRDILNLYSKIYRDENPQSGYFYYLPSDYTLGWNQSNGFDLVLEYLSGSEREKGIIVKASLESRIDDIDIEIAKYLLKAELENEPINKFRELVPIPLDTKPKTSFDQVTNYGVEVSSINTSNPKDFQTPIQISWRMNSPENLMTGMLSGLGLWGSLNLSPSGKNMPDVEVGLALKLNDSRTFKKLSLNKRNFRNARIDNPTPYNLVVKNMHVLILESQNGNKKPIIYSWDLSNTILPFGGLLSINGGNIPRWLEQEENVKKVWIEYEIPVCAKCNFRVQKQLIPETSSAAKSHHVELTVLNALEFTQAALIKIKLRSIQAKPNAKRKINLKTIIVQEDGVTLPVAELFVPDGSKISFEYSLVVILADGTSYQSDLWLPYNDLDLVIGEKQIKESISIFNDK